MATQSKTGRGTVFYSSGQQARMQSGWIQYPNPGFGGAAYQRGVAYYPSGHTMRGPDGTLYYQNGQAARLNGRVYYQDGRVAFENGAGRYANGTPTGGGVTLRQPFNGGFMAILVKRGSPVGYLVIQLGDGWQLVVNVDSGEWEVTQ